MVNTLSLSARKFVADEAAADEAVPVEFAASWADFSQNGFDVAGAVDEDKKTGWAVSPQMASNHLAVFDLASPVGGPGGTRLELAIEQHHGSGHLLGRFRISVTNDEGAQRRMTPQVARALAVAAEGRSEPERDAIAKFYRTIDVKLVELEARVAKHAETAPSPPATLAQVLSEQEETRATHVHVRGDFLRKGDRVELCTPEILPALDVRGDAPDRLDLARWIASSENPLTARVEVNRVWSYLFGQGLTRTIEDFGTRGEAPSHPKLLDWLADEFMREGWSRKRLIETVVTSATYRQSSSTRGALAETDPTNVSLSRQNRFRLEAEIVRDSFLASSGLLSPKIGGASIRPAASFRRGRIGVRRDR